MTTATTSSNTADRRGNRLTSVNNGRYRYTENGRRYEHFKHSCSRKTSETPDASAQRFFHNVSQTHRQRGHGVLDCEIETSARAQSIQDRVQTPGYVPKKKPGGFFWVHPPKKPTKKNLHFYFNLILVYTLYAANNAIFYCF